MLRADGVAGQLHKDGPPHQNDGENYQAIWFTGPRGVVWQADVALPGGFAAAKAEHKMMWQGARTSKSNKD